MKSLFFCLTFLCLIGTALSYSGVDLSTLTSQSSFSCLVSNGYHFTVVRGYMSTGQPDPNCPQSVANAWAGGMSYVDVYFFPCPTCSASAASQIDQAVNSLRNNNVKFGMFWLDIEGTQYWTSSTGTNQAFFASLLSTARSAGLNVGVYTSASQWNPIMGSGYTGGSSAPLWYAHYDGNPSFSDFVPFGGWTKPNIKQYQGTTSLCGAGVDLDWYP